MHGLNGYFVSVEGVQGSGKTMLVRGLAETFAAHGYDVVVTAELAGCELGQQVRELIDGTLDHRDPVIETLLLTAARRQLLQSVIIPTLLQGGMVICERYLHSTLVYQSACSDMLAETPLALHAAACEDMWPDLTLLLDADAETTLSRGRPHIASDMVARGARATQDELADAYRRAMQYTPEGDYAIIDATEPAAKLLQRAVRLLTVNDRFDAYLERRPDLARPRVV